MYLPAYPNFFHDEIGNEQLITSGLMDLDLEHRLFKCYLDVHILKTYLYIT